MNILKNFAIIVLLSFPLISFSQDTKCELSQNRIKSSFVLIEGDPSDRDLYSIEKKEAGSIKFLLKEGHGIMRLEVYKKNQFYASTFVQVGTGNMQPELNIALKGDKSNSIEVFCSNLLEK